MNLPLVNRDLYSLLSITGGVTSNDASNSLGGPEQTTTINGSQKAQIGTVNFQLDGGNNTAGLRGTGNPAPNPEAIQEFRVITSSYAAEYGRYPAGVVDVVTKSGTNQYHGAAFEFFRNESAECQALGAAGHDRDQGPARSQSVRRGVRRPAAARQDVLLRQLLRPAPGETYYRNTAVVPTALERPATSRSRRSRPNDPSTGQPFPGGIIPAARFDPAAQTIQDRYVPLSNLPNNFYEVSAARSAEHRRGDLQARSSFVVEPLAGGQLSST